MSDIPRPAKGVRPLLDFEAGRSLASELQPMVDELRQIRTDFGIAIYRVFLVWARWSGERRGDGRLIVADRQEILPTPKVADISSVGQMLRAFGVVEEGGVTVSRITKEWSEDVLMGLRDGYVDGSTRLGRTLQPDVEFWWEIIEQRDREMARPRRFRVSGTPTLTRSVFGWEVVLEKQDYDVDRSGTVTQ
uniref:Uncharacterized protein n=1 Tax=viral metagenome TaxID=1070528 RepID=A0A6H1Z932_9ZZZZ